MGNFDSTLSEIQAEIAKTGSCSLSKQMLDKLTSGTINTDAKFDEKAVEFVAAHEWLIGYDIHYLYDSVTFIGPADPLPPI